LADHLTQTTVELTFEAARHGWAVADTPVYQREGAEHHWDRLLALFRATLQAG
jgi:dienelactone hydrolase